jgi:glutamate formiminotransferase
MNLVNPTRFGPADAFDTVRELAEAGGGTVSRAELVGLLPLDVLVQIASQRWTELDLDEDRTVERRIERLGLSR